MTKNDIYYSDYVRYNFKNERGYYLSGLSGQLINKDNRKKFMHKINTYNECMYKFYKKNIIENIKLNFPKSS